MLVNKEADHMGSQGKYNGDDKYIGGLLVMSNRAGKNLLETLSVYAVLYCLFMCVHVFYIYSRKRL